MQSNQNYQNPNDQYFPQFQQQPGSNLPNGTYEQSQNGIYNPNQLSYQNQQYNQYSEYPVTGNDPYSKNNTAYQQSQYQTTESNNNQNQPNNLDMAIQGTQAAKHMMMNQNRNSDDSSFEAADFTDKKTRLGFIKKVFGIVAVQLLITTLVCMVPMFIESFKEFQTIHWYIVILTSVLSIAIIYIVVYTKLGRKVPINYILLIVFTLCEAYTVSYIASKYDPETVALAAGLTCLIVTGLSLYAAFTKTDFTKCGGILFVCLIALIGGSIMGFFFRNKIVRLVIAVAGVIIFGVYLIFDIQLIIGNKKNKMSKDDYILAAMMLYIDIIQIFLYLLQILGIAGGN
jgi:FtsH-binding integral membrane protein